MQGVRKLTAYVWVAVVLAGAYTSWVFLARYTRPVRRGIQIEANKGAREAEWQRTYGGNAVKILQFYASEATATEGKKSLICYGVLNAKAIRIEPLREAVLPALNRCVEIEPLRDTRYTLTAEG